MELPYKMVRFNCSDVNLDNALQHVPNISRGLKIAPGFQKIWYLVLGYYRLQIKYPYLSEALSIIFIVVAAVIPIVLRDYLWAIICALVPLIYLMFVILKCFFPTVPALLHTGGDWLRYTTKKNEFYQSKNKILVKTLGDNLIYKSLQYEKIEMIFSSEILNISPINTHYDEDNDICISITKICINKIVYIAQGEILLPLFGVSFISELTPVVFSYDHMYGIIDALLYHTIGCSMAIEIYHMKHTYNNKYQASRFITGNVGPREIYSEIYDFLHKTTGKETFLFDKCCCRILDDNLRYDINSCVPNIHALLHLIVKDGFIFCNEKNMTYANNLDVNIDDNFIDWNAGNDVMQKQFAMRDNLENKFKDYNKVNGKNILIKIYAGDMSDSTLRFDNGTDKVIITLLTKSY